MTKCQVEVDSHSYNIPRGHGHLVRQDTWLSSRLMEVVHFKRLGCDFTRISHYTHATLTVAAAVCCQ